MSLYGKFGGGKRTIKDPVLGSLVYHNGEWSGEPLFRPVGHEVLLSIVTAGEEPSAEHRATFTSLVDRYTSLRGPIGLALFTAWKKHLENHPGAPAVVATPTEMLAHTALDWIDVQAGGLVKLGYSFTEDVHWPDAMLSARVAGTEITAEVVSD